MLIYLDWNIFNKIEYKKTLDSKEIEIYDTIENKVLQENIECPYSNAHLNDLLRGYAKSSQFIDTHLYTLNRLSNSLCLCLYWNQDKVRFHYRDTKEFFFLLLEETEMMPQSFDEYIEFLSDEIGQNYDLLKLIPLDFRLIELLNNDPLLNKMFKRSQKEPNIFSLTGDILDILLLINKDFSIYKSLRNFLSSSNKIADISKGFETAFKINALRNPAENDSIATLNNNNDTLKLDLLIQEFLKMDIQGIKKDKQFINMVDDSLHSFYAAHCDYFVTNDNICSYKAKKTFEKLSIKTTVINAEELYKLIISGVV